MCTKKCAQTLNNIFWNWKKKTYTTCTAATLLLPPSRLEHVQLSLLLKLQYCAADGRTKGWILTQSDAVAWTTRDEINAKKREKGSENLFIKWIYSLLNSIFRWKFFAFCQRAHREKRASFNNFQFSENYNAFEKDWDPSSLSSSSFDACLWHFSLGCE